MNLRDELEVIRERRGHLTPAAVVDEARTPDHPLHGRFEWDDEVAGDAWRRQQAHELIRSVRVTYTRPSGEVGSLRAYHAVPTDGGREHTYEPAEEIASNPLLTALLLREMERDWRELKDRWGMFNEFVELVRSDVAVPA